MSFNKSDKISSRELSPELLQKINYLEDSKISKDYKVSGDTVGAWASGVTIPAGTLVSDVLEGILNENFKLIYKPPKLSFDNLEIYYEVGQHIDSLLIKPDWEQNDAGNITAYELYRDRKDIVGYDETQVIDSVNIVDYYEGMNSNDPVDIIEYEGPILSYRAVVSYNAGKKKMNDETNSYYEGNIVAGSIEKTITLTGYRKIFFGADNETTPCNDYLTIRSLPQYSTRPIYLSDEFIIKCPAGIKRVTFATTKNRNYEFEIRSYTTGYKIFNSKSPGSNPVVFTKEEITINDMNIDNEVIYDVYSYIPPAGFPEEDIYIVSIIEK